MLHGFMPLRTWAVKSIRFIADTIPSMQKLIFDVGTDSAIIYSTYTGNKILYPFHRAVNYCLKLTNYCLMHITRIQLDGNYHKPLAY